MHRLSILLLTAALLGASPARAMRAHDFIDADQRVSTAARGERPAVLVVEQAPDTPAPASADHDLLPPAPSPTPAAATTVSSPVPEPSGLAMLTLGLLLLFLQPHKRVERLLDEAECGHSHRNDRKNPV